VTTCEPFRRPAGAAKFLRITRPTLSRQLRHLERRLGARLVAR